MPNTGSPFRTPYRFGRYGHLLLATALWACGGEGTTATRWGGSVDTLPSGAVVVSNPAEGFWTERERWSLVEGLRIGTLDGDGPDAFGAVGHVTADALGRVYVLESQSAEVRVFDREGRHLRTLGGRGNGPGELMSPTRLLWGPGGDLWIHDPRNRRYEVFDTTGVRVGSRPLEGLPFGFAGAAFGDDGLLYEMVPAAPSGGGMSMVLVSFRLQGDERTAVDTFAAPPLPQPQTFETRVQSGERTLTMRMPLPFQSSQTRHIHPGGYFWSNHGGDAYRLLQEGFEGDTIRIVERAYEPVPVSAAEIDEAFAGLPGGAPAGLDRSEIPRARPPFESFTWGPDGWLWVLRYHAPGERAWDVFDAEGRYAGELATDLDLDRFTLHHVADDAVYGIARDELDVPYVVRLRIVRGEGDSGG